MLSRRYISDVTFWIFIVCTGRQYIRNHLNSPIATVAQLYHSALVNLLDTYSSVSHPVRTLFQLRLFYEFQRQ